MSHTFVLVHGGFHGGWCWRDVARPLRAAGHRVTTPTLTGLGEKRHLTRAVTGPDTFVEDVVNHLIMEDLTGVVLVGHSLGGLPTLGAADRVPERLRQLVFLDALLVEGGEAANDTVPAEAVAERRAMVDRDGEGYLWPDFPLSALGIAEDHPRAQWVRERITPLPYATYEQPLTLDHEPGNGLTADYIVCTDPIFASLAGARARATEAGWTMHEMATGHDAMVLMPDELAELLISIADRGPGDRS